MTTKLLEEILYEEKLDMMPQRAAEEISLRDLDQFLKECPPTEIMYSSVLSDTPLKQIFVPLPSVRVACSEIIIDYTDALIHIRSKENYVTFSAIKEVRTTGLFGNHMIIYLHSVYNQKFPEYAADCVLLVRFS